MTDKRKKYADIAERNGFCRRCMKKRPKRQDCQELPPHVYKHCQDCLDKIIARRRRRTLRQKEVPHG